MKKRIRKNGRYIISRKEIEVKIDQIRSRVETLSMPYIM